MEQRTDLGDISFATDAKPSESNGAAGEMSMPGGAHGHYVGR